MMPADDPNMVTVEDNITPPLADESVYPHHHTETRTEEGGKYFLSKFKKYKVPLAVVLAFLLLLVTLLVSGSDSGGSSAPSMENLQAETEASVEVEGRDAVDKEVVVDTVAEPEEVTSEVDEDDSIDTRMKNVFGMIMSVYTTIGIPADHGLEFEDEDSPQYRALRWTCSNAHYHDIDDERKLQRYSLAAFFYSTYAVKNTYVTNQVPWSSAELWLSEEDECNWEGIKCDATKAAGDDLGNDSTENYLVSAIYLPEHRVSGALPYDIVLLRETLTSIILTNNMLYMEGDELDVFQYMTKLKSIHLDDNYIVNREGLPNSFRGLSNLRKLVLSYNLLQGSLRDTYFSEMKQLSHLEIESNYLTGSLPSSLRKKSNLIYLYIRRNDFSFNLEEMLQDAQWPDLFSLWFDHNEITGPFPTEIGELTQLASLSITNTSLTGTLPTELAQITGLRRAWFYGNELTGEIPEELGTIDSLEVFEIYGNEISGGMPQGICDSVAKADYEFKELSSDCDKVDCDDCCTSCY